MNTSTAAAEARVTVATIRTWCRRNVIAAVKTAGRWVIDAASLARRIAIGKVKRMTVPLYGIEEGTETLYGKTTPTYKIVRTCGEDGRLWETYYSRETAEMYKEFFERTPNGYHLERKFHSPKSGRGSGYYWLISGHAKGDVTTLNRELPESADPAPRSTAWLNLIVGIVTAHAEGREGRIAVKAEKTVVAAAEKAVREERERQVVEARRVKGELATPKQVVFILQLLAARERNGEGGGFYAGPTNRAEIETMSKGEASLYIDSLKGAY